MLPAPDALSRFLQLLRSRGRRHAGETHPRQASARRARPHPAQRLRASRRAQGRPACLARVSPRHARRHEKPAARRGRDRARLPARRGLFRRAPVHPAAHLPARAIRRARQTRPPARQGRRQRPAHPRRRHDRAKQHVLAADAAWLRALGVTNDRGQPREGMAHKFRQIEKFAELLRALLAESGLDGDAVDTPPHGALRIADMGAGKGYLTFALAALLEPRAQITGLERRADLVATCNHIAAGCGRAKVFEFIATEHTAKNLMIAAHRLHAPDDPAFAAQRGRLIERTRAFAAFYGIRDHRLAFHLGIGLCGEM